MQEIESPSYLGIDYAVTALQSGRQQQQLALLSVAELLTPS